MFTEGSKLGGNLHCLIEFERLDDNAKVPPVSIDGIKAEALKGSALSAAADGDIEASASLQSDSIQ